MLYVIYIYNETNMIDEIIHKASEMDNDTLHLIDGKLNKIIARARKKLKISPENKAEDKTMPKTKNKAEDKDNNIPKAKYIYEDIKENRYIRTFIRVRMPVKKKMVTL